MRPLNRSLWSRLLAVGLPFFRSEGRGRAFAGCALLNAACAQLSDIEMSHRRRFIPGARRHENRCLGYW